MKPWYAAGALLLTTTLAGCGPAAQAPSPGATSSSTSSPPSPKPSLISVKMGLAVNILAFAPLQIAHAKHYFRQQGLKVNVITLSGGTTSTEALSSGSLQFNASASTDVIRADQHGLHMLAIANILNGNDVELTVGQKLVQQYHLSSKMPLKQRLAPLLNHLYGITSAGSVSQVDLELLFKSVGLNPKQLHFIAIGSAAALNASLRAGKIAGYLLGPPAGEIAQHDGFGQVLVSVGGAPVFNRQDFTDIYTTDHYAHQHPAVVKKVATAIANANRFLVDHPRQAARIVARNFKGVSLSILETSLRKEPWDKTATFSQAGWKSAEAALAQSGAVKGTLPSTKPGVMWTNQFLPHP